MEQETISLMSWSKKYDWEFGTVLDFMASISDQLKPGIHYVGTLVPTDSAVADPAHMHQHVLLRLTPRGQNVLFGLHPKLGVRYNDQIFHRVSAVQKEVRSRRFSSPWKLGKSPSSLERAARAFAFFDARERSAKPIKDPLE